LLEEVIAFGCQKFIVCGGCGVLEPTIAVGHLMILTGALRDEGISYHYLPPRRVVSVNPQGVAVLELVLLSRNLPCELAITRTTDAPYRETEEKKRNVIYRDVLC
jgi:uridine phosphorylase